MTPWPRTPFFAVGPATSGALRSLAQTLPAPFRPRLVLGGSATGTGEALANYIIKHFAEGGPGSKPEGWDALKPPRKSGSTSSGGGGGSSASGGEETEEEEYDGPPPIEPLLILTGDKNLPTIPEMLASVGKPPKRGSQAEAALKATELLVNPPVKFQPDLMKGPPSAGDFAQADPAAARKRLYTPPKPPQLHEMQPLPFELLQVYETAEDPLFDEHLNSFEQALPPTSSRPNSRRPSASDGDHLMNYAAATGITAMASGPAGSGTASPGATLLPPLSTETSVPSSATVSRRGSLKAKILAERLHAVNKAALASGSPSPFITTPGSEIAPPANLPAGLAPLTTTNEEGSAQDSRAMERHASQPSDPPPPTLLETAAAKAAADMPSSRTEPAGASQGGASSVSPPQITTSFTNSTGEQGANSSGSSKSTPPSPLSGKPYNAISANVFARSPLALEPKELAPDAAANTNGSLTPGTHRPSVSSSLLHENTLGRLDEDSALTDEALLEHAIVARQQKQGKAHKPDWIVFFSPSGVEYALPHLRRRKWLPPAPPADSKVPGIDAKPGAGDKYPRIAVLGPTTKRWIREHLHIIPDAAAATPGAGELKEAVSLVDKRRRMEKIRKQIEEHSSGSKQKET